MLISIHSFCFNSFKIYFAERSSDQFTLKNCFDSVWLAQSEFNGITHATKQLEWLNARYLLKYACEQDSLPFYSLTKDTMGKPYLANSHAQISISHTSKYVACMVHKSAACGIDCERLTERFYKVSPRVMSNAEQKELISIDHHTVYWSAKEAMFKLYGAKQVDFKEHLHILPFELNNIGVKFNGIIDKDEPIDAALFAFKLDLETWCVAAFKI